MFSPAHLPINSRICTSVLFVSSNPDVSMRTMWDPYKSNNGVSKAAVIYNSAGLSSVNQYAALPHLFLFSTTIATATQRTPPHHLVHLDYGPTVRTTWNHDGHPTKAITKAVEAELGAASNWKVRGEGKNPLTAGRGKAFQVRSMCPSQPTQLPPSLKQKKQTQHPPPNQQRTRWQRRHEWPCHAAGPTPPLCSITMPLTLTGASFRNICRFQ